MRSILAWFLARGLQPTGFRKSTLAGQPGATGIHQATGLIGLVIGLLITIYVLAQALPLGITALLAVDTGSTLFNTFMNTIFPLLVAAFAIFVGLRFLTHAGDGEG